MEYIGQILPTSPLFPSPPKCCYKRVLQSLDFWIVGILFFGKCLLGLCVLFDFGFFRFLDFRIFGFVYFLIIGFLDCWSKSR